MNAPDVPRRAVQLPPRFDAELEARYRESRVTSLTAVNRNTFWSTAILILVFSLWDAFADPAHWRTAFGVRLAGAMVIVATGLFQKLPGRSLWMPFLAKVRLVAAIVASLLAATMLERGYGFGVAGVAVIFLTGPYIAIDRVDLLKMNLAAALAIAGVMLAVSPDPFDMIGTAVFLFLAVLVSTLLGRVIEASNRRAFALELELHRDARTDALTGLNNRRAVQERGPVELKRAKRSGAPVSVILGDLDHFKNINDRYGHEAGDAALAKVASVLQAVLRETDALGRWGGEEFIAVLAASDAAAAREVAERMRVAVAAIALDGLDEKMTISLGVSTLPSVDDPASAWDVLVKEADQRLYRAKSEGRNRVVSAP